MLEEGERVEHEHDWQETPFTLGITMVGEAINRMAGLPPASAPVEGCDCGALRVRPEWIGPFLGHPTLESWSEAHGGEQLPEGRVGA